jgi:hypothetical protein
MTIWIAVWLLSVGAAYAIPLRRGRNGVAVLLGALAVLIGPIATLLALAVPRNEAAMNGGQRQCPACAEWVRVQAIRCKHCGSELQPSTTRALSS